MNKQLKSILKKKGTFSNNQERFDKYGIKIDVKGKKHRIKFDEKIQVFQVENWKNYNDCHEERR